MIAFLELELMNKGWWLLVNFRFLSMLSVDALLFVRALCFGYPIILAFSFCPILFILSAILPIAD